MGRIRTLIVDDEPIARRGIRRQLQFEPDVEIVGECGNGREAVVAIKELSPDLVFLDVQMPLLDGFGVIESLGIETSPAVVFVTAYDEHAIRAFEVNALDYLLKPIDPERFQKTLARAREQSGSAQTKRLNRKLSALLESLKEFQPNAAQPAYLERIAIKEQGRVFFLSVEQLDWLRAQGNYVELHVESETHLLTHTSGLDEISPGRRTSNEAEVVPLGAFLKTRIVRRLPPGEVISYSTYNPTLAAHAVAQITETPFKVYLRQNIFEPLGMNRTSITAVKKEYQQDLASGYEYAEGNYQKLPFQWFHTYPASDINSTATDMARFMLANLNGGALDGKRVLSRDSMQEMHRTQFRNHPCIAGWAYGFYEGWQNNLRWR